jgi:hypothetical protein
MFVKSDAQIATDFDEVIDAEVSRCWKVVGIGAPKRGCKRFLQ